MRSLIGTNWHFSIIPTEQRFPKNDRDPNAHTLCNKAGIHIARFLHSIWGGRLYVGLVRIHQCKPFNHNYRLQLIVDVTSCSHCANL